MRKVDTRDCKGCHDDSSLAASQRDKPMYDGADLSGITSIRSSAMSWDYIKRLRDQLEAQGLSVELTRAAKLTVVDLAAAVALRPQARKRRSALASRVRRAWFVLHTRRAGAAAPFR